MTTGWIKLHRAILDWEWWSDRNTRDLFIYCLLMANHDDEIWQGKTIERGSFVTTLQSLSDNVGITKQQTRRAIFNIQNTGEITIKTTNKNTIITVCNYDKYQYNGIAEQHTEKQTNNTQNNTQTTRKTTHDNIILRNKEDKKERIEELLLSSSPREREYIYNKIEEEQGEKKEEGRVPDDGSVMRDINTLYSEYRIELEQGGESMAGLIRIMNNRGSPITRESVLTALDDFQTTLIIGKTTQKTPSDYRRHFLNYLSKTIDLYKTKPNNGNNNDKPRERTAYDRMHPTRGDHGYYTDF